ncbi:flavin monooxygenase isoform X2 [Takifugu rubripes]|uniref:flavin monooxygenase isoform X2 n=1 Tax=Takifugu rubripes TaxID=31033 RepID=UPI0005D1B95A|nr:flavin monooxygenase isoform X2 [Takifugu rubripes]|eukprot:XP_011612915.1 PREDICTED: flavin monooxygenase isoform X1 [Takifugu rubripes]
MVHRVAVIGAGASGLASVKACIEGGLEPVCFERGHDIGGVWNFRESLEPGRASIYRSLVANTSKEMMCFSDFPMPADYPNYLHHSQLLGYLRLYVQHFDLLRHIRFQTTVTRVAQRAGFPQSGQWDVVTVNASGEEEKHVFDAVLVCSGQFIYPSLPDFPGHEGFPGKCSHSWEYRDPEAYRGLRVLVVGIGNSGGDIAVEISRSAEMTFLSTRQGAWVIGRMSHRGLPLDVAHITRFKQILMKLLPQRLINWLLERALNQKYDHRFYGLQPKHRRLFPPSLLRPTLAILGLFQAKGPIVPLVEMQGRWAARVFAGLSFLPPKKKMLEVIESDRKRNSKSHSCHKSSSLKVHYIPYMDFMAQQVGVRPNLLRLLLTDPVLWAKALFGPCTPYQYRLTGPGHWTGARQAILTQWDRMAQPFRTRVVPEADSAPAYHFLPFLFVLGGITVATVYGAKLKLF